MEATKKGYKIAHEGDGIDISGRMEYHRGTVQKGLAQTIKTKPDVGVVVNGEDNLKEILCDKPVVKQNLRIRKLTPKDCIRLMGFADDDYEAMRSIGMGDSAIEHMAGDSIIVTVLIAIFSQLFDDNKHKEIINNYVEKNVIENKKIN